MRILGGEEPVASRSEVLGDGTIRGEKALGESWGLEPPHPSLSLAGRLVGVLGAVIEIAMLAMFHPRQECPRGRTIAYELIRDDHTWDVVAAFLSLRRCTRMSSAWPS
jgi:hypothetical protein